MLSTASHMSYSVDFSSFRCFCLGKSEIRTDNGQDRYGGMEKSRCERGISRCVIGKEKGKQARDHGDGQVIHAQKSDTLPCLPATRHVEHEEQNAKQPEKGGECEIEDGERFCCFHGVSFRVGDAFFLYFSMMATSKSTTFCEQWLTSEKNCAII